MICALPDGLRLLTCPEIAGLSLNLGVEASFHQRRALPYHTLLSNGLCDTTSSCKLVSSTKQQTGFGTQKESSLSSLHIHSSQHRNEMIYYASLLDISRTVVCLPALCYDIQSVRLLSSPVYPANS